MSDDVSHRLSTEGVDPLALAGVNDANLVALARRLGVRVALRGDTLTLAGAQAAVERATVVAQALVDLARMGDMLGVADVERAAGEERPAPGRSDEMAIILPGLRRVIQPKTGGQRDYLAAILQREIVVGIGPAGTGKTYLAVAACGASSSRDPRSRRGRVSGSYPATCATRSIRTCGRSTTPSKT